MSKGWAASDIPDQTGRVAVITGANTGLGFEAAVVLAARGAHVVLAVRNPDRGGEAAARIIAAHPGADVTVQQLDLASLDSVRTAADQLRSAHPRIDLLINNAGVMYPPRSSTKDGFELQLGTNHLGHFALTGLLLDRLLPVAGSRVLTVSSVAHKVSARIHFEDLQLERHYSPEAAYSQSKLANVMFTYELQRRLSGKGTTVAVVAHPGLSDTDLIREPPLYFRVFYTLTRPFITQSAAMGALPILRGATDPDVCGGDFLGPSKLAQTRGAPRVVKAGRRAHDEAAQRRLWAISEELTGVTFPV
ncbi:SDR family NAD(P)-dependent oxidoreductase [Mycobacterium sp.]|uniref:SDR family NAD(P)-dependent oxidoreductase n=1 Tax=Mycobacterium sp. TaxID=1785 RepID=UPI002D816F41|nr:SDR family NAD(P)-dependent oxidoreductase [Mycobacterium sp.]